MVSIYKKSKKSPVNKLQSLLLGAMFCLLSSNVLDVSKAHAKDEKSVNIISAAIDTAWAGHRIKPYLLTRGQHQFVAYFDANRQMSIAHRVIGKPWRYFKVDSYLGWDSHNYVTMELDSTGHLHVTGNMHGDPIEYFRMSEPFNVRSLERIDIMVDKSLERRMTYPVFMLNKTTN